MSGFFIDTFFLPWFGVDLPNRKAVIVGDGNQPASFTHRKDVGKSVAKLILKDNCKEEVIRLESEAMTLNNAFKLYEQIKVVKLDLTYDPINEVKKRIASESTDIWAKAIDALRLAIAEGLGKNSSPIYPSINPISIKDYFNNL